MVRLVCWETWAWSSDVSSRRSQLDTDTSDNVIEESEEESPRTARKVETESVEARFFLKDKLCAIAQMTYLRQFNMYNL